MKVIDVIFALIAGRTIAFVINDFLKEGDIHLSLLGSIILSVVVSFIALFCLWIASWIGRRILSVFQAAKHLLVGAFATVVDLKLFELMTWSLNIISFMNPITSKVISFLVSTIIKYAGNKYWAFQKHEKENIHEEVIQFFYITLIGLAIDVGFFFYLTKMIGPQFQLETAIWIKLGVIISAIVAAAWNFLGYKFLVFKK